ncbi:MAG TPA: Arc family DNA-binding protein [Prolixibacteraceae bacterium]
MATKKSFVLRIDPEVSNALERWAADEFRSMNGQIEFLLSQALKKAGRLPKKKKNADSEDNNKSEPE